MWFTQVLNFWVWERGRDKDMHWMQQTQREYAWVSTHQQPWCLAKNQNLSVKTRDGKLWGGDDKGYPRIYAVGDCNYSCVDEPGKKPDDWPIPPIPKISYPGEEMCIVACSNIEKTDRLLFQNKTVDCCGEPLHVWDMHWPWGAGMFATSLGPDDACFVAGANWQKNSGLMCVWGQVCAVQKEFIEASKTDECAYGCWVLTLYWLYCFFLFRIMLFSSVFNQFRPTFFLFERSSCEWATSLQASLVAAFGTSSITPRCISLVAVLDGATETDNQCTYVDFHRSCSLLHHPHLRDFRGASAYSGFNWWNFV